MQIIENEKNLIVGFLLSRKRRNWLATHQVIVYMPQKVLYFLGRKVKGKEIFVKQKETDYQGGYK